MTAVVLSVSTPADAQSNGMFRSVAEELRNRPRGGVIDLFDRPSLPTTQANRRGRFDAWFWRGVSPSRHDAEPERLLAAAELAASGPYPPAPAPALRAVMDRHGDALVDAAAAHGISLPLLLSLVMVESGGRAEAVSPVGATGLTQLMPSTAALMEVADSNDPYENAMGGARYLARMLARFDGDAILALAAYNAGPGAVAEARGVPRYAETRAYVPKVLATWTVARTLCETPPEGPTDPCAM
ncbi:lytic transglycosylase domain-containing protein [Roseobacter sp. HKCCA0434]|uniref:lytic transglycosylase domain-containing protein n=1 Tax=Roseobacter sp. HKCCA0434 TaxID=3079297 RepID=UPI0029058CA9|nr:lytic transglycosylase domain-containing protein [Roseobacter sp. HKCCA0434]